MDHSSNFLYSNEEDEYNYIQFTDDDFNESYEYENSPDNSYHSKNIERRIMERDGMFNIDSRDGHLNAIKNVATRFPINSSVGEITGQKYNMSKLDQGMPMRSIHTPTMKIDEDSEANYQFYNPSLDFDLYDTKPSKNVSYFDPYSTDPNTTSSFSNVDSNGSILKSDDFNHTELNGNKFSNSVNTFSFGLLNSFNKIINKNTIVLSPFSILLPLIILYRGSKYRTEQEITNFFRFSNKEEVFRSAQTLLSNLKQRVPVVFSNWILLPKNLPVNRAFTKYVNSVGNIIQINSRNPIGETSRINDIIGRDTNGLIRAVLSPGLLNPNSVIVLISSIYIRSKWRYSFNRKMLRKEMFFNNPKHPVDMMCMVGKMLNYFEDDKNQIIELPFAKNSTVMGFILPKRNKRPHVTTEQFEFYISQLNPTNIKTLKIPKFRHQSKLKIDNIFKKMGMQEIFTNADLSEITPANDLLFVSDIIHQATIIIDERGEEPPTTDDSIGGVNFIANHPFLFYIRYSPTNTLLFIGNYF